MSSEAIWFLANLVEVHYPAADGQPALLEITAAPGDMPPLHRHVDEHEGFYVLEGSLQLWVGDDAVTLAPGEGRRAPAGVPHTYRAGEDGARFLVSAGAGFEGFVRAMGTPAARRELPAHTPPDPAVLGPRAAAAGIELLGPPGTLPTDVAAAAV